MLIRGLLAGCLLAALLVPGPASAQNQEYWSFQEYLATFPEQQPLFEHFSERVRKPARPLTAPTGKPVQIAIIYPGEQVSDYWYRSQQSFTSRLQEIGVRYTLESHFFRPDTGLREQERQIANALANNPDYLIFTLDAQRHRVLIEKIMARGRPKLILQNITTPLKRWGSHQPFFYVGFDHSEGTRLLTEAIKKTTGGQASYLMLYGTQGYVSMARGDEFIRLTSRQPGFIQRQAFYTDVNREKSTRAVLQAMAIAPDINLIYACTTDIAIGAIDALKILGKEDEVVLNGWGGGSAELDALEQGSLDLTVMRMNDDNGVAMAEAIRLDLEGNRGQIPRVYSGDFVVIRQDTPAAELERLKSYAFRYSK